MFCTRAFFTKTGSGRTPETVENKAAFCVVQGWEVSEQVDSMKMLANRPYEAGEKNANLFCDANLYSK